MQQNEVAKMQRVKDARSSVDALVYRVAPTRSKIYQHFYKKRVVVVAAVHIIMPNWVQRKIVKSGKNIPFYSP